MKPEQTSRENEGIKSERDPTGGESRVQDANELSYPRATRQRGEGLCERPTFSHSPSGFIIAWVVLRVNHQIEISNGENHK